MLNSVSIMGRLVRDPELRRTQTGISVTTMRIAVDRDFKSQDGTRQADFFDVVAWRNTAEFASRYFTKGRMMVVSGHLQTRNWEDRDGNKRISTEIVAENIYFGDSKRDSNGGDFGSPPPYGSPVGSYGSGSSSGYGAASPGYGAPPAYGGDAASQSGGADAAPGYGSPSGPQSDFADLGEEDGDLPF